MKPINQTIDDPQLTNCRLAVEAAAAAKKAAADADASGGDAVLSDVQELKAPDELMPLVLLQVRKDRSAVYDSRVRRVRRS